MVSLDFAVIGNPIQHSLSPLIHKLFARQVGIEINYDKLCVETNLFAERVRDFFNLAGVGLNVTQPFKELAYELSDIRTKSAIKVRAANTLWMKDNKIYAANTDGLGFIIDISRYIDLRDKKILILGAGGAARGVIGVLLDSFVQSITIFNRTRQKVLNIIDDLQDPRIICADKELKDDYEIIINTVPARALISAQVFSNAKFCYDLVYEVSKPTEFMAVARKFGVMAVDGIGMLVEQAAESFQIWHGVRPQTAPVIAALV